MANENQINTNSVEYKAGSKSGWINGLSVGSFITLIATVGAFYVDNVITKSKRTNLEKTLSSSETVKAVKELRQSENELYTSIERMWYDSHPDEAATNAIVECRKPYAAVLKDCISQDSGERMKCMENAIKRTPKAQAGYDACLDKYEDKVMGIETCGVKFSYTTNDTIYDKCDATHNEKVKACSKTSYDTFNQCREKALEQGFKRFQAQKNLQKGK